MTLVTFRQCDRCRYQGPGGQPAAATLTLRRSGDEPSFVDFEVCQGCLDKLDKFLNGTELEIPP